MGMDDRKKGMLLLLVAAVVLVALITVAMVSGRRGRPADPPRLKNAVAEIPEGEEEDISESKIEAYNGRGGDRRSNIERYWDEVAREDDDPMASLGEDRRPKYREVTEEELFGAGEEKPKAAPAGAGRTAWKPDPAPPPEPAPESAPKEDEDRIDARRVAVRRSGLVSSVGDGFGSVGSSGVSSLDGGDDELAGDDSYPFKCMFVRDERIRGGERVPVRLLEDMVVGGQLVPKNTHLMASCSLGKRLEMNIASIEIAGKILTLDYDAYDANDGGRGIYCPDVDNRVSRQVKRQAGNNIFMRARSKAGEVAQDVLETGSVVVTGTGNDVSVTVPSGYQFYIVKSRRGGA